MVLEIQVQRLVPEEHTELQYPLVFRGPACLLLNLNKEAPEPKRIHLKTHGIIFPAGPTVQKPRAKSIRPSEPLTTPSRRKKKVSGYYLGIPVRT